MFINKLLSATTLSAALALTTLTNIASATPLADNMDGGGCIVNTGNYADDVITITNADLVKAHGVMAPGTTITHVVNFAYDFGVTDQSCAGATATISLDTPTFPASTAVSFDSLVLDGAISNVSIVDNSGTLALTLTMTTQEQVDMATPFTYSVPFTINADVSI
ncbi:MAG: hypothetical protein R3F02_16845 [Thiolinea sp.]